MMRLGWAQFASPRALLSISVTAAAIVTATPAPAADLDGIWKSRGYGEIVVIKADQAVVYDVNSVACFERAPSKVDDDLFREPKITAGGSEMTTLSALGLEEIVYERLPQLPDLCAKKPDAKDPLLNFDVFVAWFAEHYVGSGYRGVDWQVIRDQFRPRLTARSSDSDLGEVFQDIYRQLQDYHVQAHAGPGFMNAGFGPLQNTLMREYRQHAGQFKSPAAFGKFEAKQYLRPSWQRYLDKGSVKDVSDNVTTGTADGGRIGYVMIDALSGYGPVYKLKPDQEAARNELDGVFAAMQGKRALIIDMRINFGGHSDVALALAGLLTGADRPGFSFCARDGRTFTPVQHTSVVHRPNAFLGPVIVLTSNYDVSAGEEFLLIAKDLPNVLIVGDRTASVFSGTITKPLPNGWTIDLPNEEIVAPDGSTYEGIGVAPDILVPYYPEEVKAAGIDPLMEKALHLLSAKDVSETISIAKRTATAGRPSTCS